MLVVQGLQRAYKQRHGHDNTKPNVLPLAYTGKVAYNGMTMHSTLHLLLLTTGHVSLLIEKLIAFFGLYNPSFVVINNITLVGLNTFTLANACLFEIKQVLDNHLED